MLIEKELIEQAKEKLGLKNAEIMAELLQLEDFDTKNLKARCPYHNEDTASFIYDKKRHCFHCFGCQKTVDVIDVCMEKGKTFLEAVQFLFEQSKISYSFGEMNVKTKREYRYPKEVICNSKDKVYEYFGKRKISKETIDYLDIRQDEHGNCVYNFYDTNNVLTMVKYRPARTVHKGEAKCWIQKDSDSTPLLLNMNKINVTQPLLIVEGEPDMASCVEAGFYNVVSVPLGCGNLHWIKECWDWLEQFNSIIIWSDNDEPGIKMRKECITRLGSWRTKYVETPTYYIKDNKRFPVKDANDILQVVGKDEVLRLIYNASESEEDSVVDFADVEPLEMYEMEGIKTGIKSIDNEIYSIFLSSVNIITGRPGSGKTSIIDQIIGNAMDEHIPVFVFSKEMQQGLTASWMDTILAGRRNLETATNRFGESYYRVNRDIQKKIQCYYRKYLHIYKDDQPNDVKSVMKSAENCIRKYGAKLIILDNLMMLDLECTEEETNKTQTKFMNDLIAFANKYKVAILLVAHPKKTQDKTADIDMYDIAGTSNLINLAMRSFGMRRVSDEEKENQKSKWKDYDVVLTLIKDRFFGKANKKIGLRYDLMSRRFYSNVFELDHKYKWDDKEYSDDLKVEEETYEFPE